MYIDGIDYSQKLAPEANLDSFTQKDLKESLDELDLPEDLKEEIQQALQQHIEEQIKRGCMEFVSKLFQVLSTSKLGLALARSLGISVYITGKDGEKKESLKDLAEIHNCVPQFISALEKEVTEMLGVKGVQNLSIARKDYKMSVDAPEGYMTIRQSLEFLNTTNKRFNSICKRLKIKTKSYVRGSKLVSLEDLDRVERFLTDGEE